MCKSSEKSEFKKRKISSSKIFLFLISIIILVAISLNFFQVSFHATILNLSTNNKLRIWSLRELGSYGYQSRFLLPSLEGMLKREEDILVALVAANTIIDIDEDTAADIFIRIFSDLTSTSTARHVSIKALAKVQFKCEYLPSITKALRDHDIEVVIAAAWALGEVNYRNKIVLDALADILKKSNEPDHNIPDDVVKAVQEALDKLNQGDRNN